MRTSYFYIYPVLIALLAFQAALGQTEPTQKADPDIAIQTADSRIESLMKNARELFDAYDKEDVAGFVEMTHPNIYKTETYNKKDGREKYFEDSKLVIELKAMKGGKNFPTLVEAPDQIFEIDKQLFAVVAYKFESLINENKDKKTSVGSMVGISEDGGQNWKFVKGVVFSEVFPDAAAMIVIPYPMEKGFVNGIEQ